MKNKHNDKGECEPPATKKRKRDQKFLPKYHSKYPVLIPSTRDSTYARCTTCYSDFSVAHGGITDCKIHVEGARHKQRFEQVKGHPSISEMFEKGRQEEEDAAEQKVKNAELLLADFLIEHNIPLDATDHAVLLFRRMFPDSKIAEGLDSERIKAAAMAKSSDQGTLQNTTDTPPENGQNTSDSSSEDGDTVGETNTDTEATGEDNRGAL